MKMENCGRRNVRKHTYIKGSENCFTFEISLNFGSLEKTRTTYSDSKYSLVISRKGFIASLGIKATTRPNKYKETRYSIVNVRTKELPRVIREFYKLSYKSY